MKTVFKFQAGYSVSRVPAIHRPTRPWLLTAKGYSRALSWKEAKVFIQNHETRFDELDNGRVGLLQFAYDKALGPFHSGVEPWYPQSDNGGRVDRTLAIAEALVSYDYLSAVGKGTVLMDDNERKDRLGLD